MDAHIDPAASIIFWGTLLLFFGLLGRYCAQRLKQPGVLGELLIGVLLGNVGYFMGMQLAVILRESQAIFSIIQSMLGGTSIATAVQQIIPDPLCAQKMLGALSGPHAGEWIKVAYGVDIFSRYGVIFLLFMVGLESSVEELRQTGRQSLSVAVIGVIAPIILGVLVMRLLLPDLSFNSQLFVAASLSATSVGITARVLRDMKKLATREAKTILGAAMIDDILGLLILAIVSALIAQGSISALPVMRTILLAGLFFVSALLVGPWVLRQSVKGLRFLERWEAKVFTAFLFLMLLSWLATCVQLASIVGAFVAGIIIHDGFFGKKDNALSLKNLLSPLELIFAPLFFILMGMQVKIETFLDWHVLLIAGGLCIAAILGKLLSGLGSARRDDRLSIGIGMLPRGEVGLVFASIGKTMGVINDQLFSSIILMVIVTTFIAPVWLKMRFSRNRARA